MSSPPVPVEVLMTPDDAAERLKMSVKTLMRHVQAGRLRFINIGTATRRVHRFTAKNLQTFIDNQKIREVPVCLSTSVKTPLITFHGLNAKVIAFTSQPKPATKKKPKL